jgi:hypothetical protein
MRAADGRVVSRLYYYTCTEIQHFCPSRFAYSAHQLRELPSLSIVDGSSNGRCVLARAAAQCRQLPKLHCYTLFINFLISTLTTICCCDHFCDTAGVPALCRIDVSLHPQASGRDSRNRSSIIANPRHPQTSPRFSSRTHLGSIIVAYDCSSAPAVSG